MEENKFLNLDTLINISNDEYLKLIKNNNVTKLLSAIGLFPDQTITNDVLILNQNPNALCVKRMKEWNFYKRNVKKGEKAIKIITHYINKSNFDYTDKSGNLHTKQVEKLKAEIGFVFDIKQTEGKEYNYLKTNKETLAQHFDITKKTLENTAKGFEFTYKEQEENSLIDFDNKTISMKSGMTLEDTIKTLISTVAKILLYSRYPEGLTMEENNKINEIEENAVAYAVSTKLLLDLPKCDEFYNIQDWTDKDIVSFKDNLQRVRSVTKQMLSNLESAIEYEIYKENKESLEEQTVDNENVENGKTENHKNRKKENESEVQNA